MKKLIAILMMIVTIFVITGCGTTTNEKTTPAKTDTKQEQSVDKDKASKNTVVAEGTGLGNTLEAWTKDYGSPKAHGDNLKGFKNDTMLVTFDGNKAVNITFKNVQMPLVRQVTPKDGKELSKSSKKTSNGEMVVKKYHSDLLAEAIPATDGNYTVIETYEGSNLNLISVVIDCTPNLSK